MRPAADHIKAIPGFRVVEYGLRLTVTRRTSSHHTLSEHVNTVRARWHTSMSQGLESSSVLPHAMRIRTCNRTYSYTWYQAGVVNIATFRDDGAQGVNASNRMVVPASQLASVDQTCHPWYHLWCCLVLRSIFSRKCTLMIDLWILDALLDLQPTFA